MVVADRLGRETGVLQFPVQGVQVLGRQLGDDDPPELGTDGLLDLRAVVPDGRRRQIKALALLQPSVEELADGGAETIGTPLAVFLDEITESVVGST